MINILSLLILSILIILGYWTDDTNIILSAGFVLMAYCVILDNDKSKETKDKNKEKDKFK